MKICNLGLNSKKEIRIFFGLTEENLEICEKCPNLSMDSSTGIITCGLLNQEDFKEE